MRRSGLWRVAIPTLILLGLGALAACSKTAAPPAPPGAVPGAAVGIDELVRLDLLPQFKRSVEVGLVSSYDRTGGNDDGFSGKYSFIRREAEGLVLADLVGPGAIYRIHTPTPTNDTIEFYFDGETRPRLSLKVIELFDGSRPPFLAPVAGWGVGGSIVCVGGLIGSGVMVNVGSGVGVSVGVWLRIRNPVTKVSIRVPSSITTRSRRS